MAKPAVTNLYGDTPHREAVDGQINKYEEFFDRDEGATPEQRKANYEGVVNSYYDVATDFYEYGWGKSFHFAARFKDETLAESIKRHEYYLAHRLGLQEGHELLDVGCGVGGPMRSIARFSGASVTGINNNAYQVQRGTDQNRDAGLSDRCSLVKADFMDMPFEAERFDAAMAIEATCHAPDRSGVFKEIARVLKPGALYAAYEWVLTDLYDKNAAEHREIKHGIENGNGLPDLVHTSVVEAALEQTGFEILDARDLALECDRETPWYLPLDASMTVSGFRHTRVGAKVTHTMVRALETLRIAPKGATATSSMLMSGAKALARGGKTGTFTPMQFYLARKK